MNPLTPKPGELCLLLPRAIDAGKLVTAVEVLWHFEGKPPMWRVDPPIRCRCIPNDGSPEYPGTTDRIEETYLLPIRRPEETEELEKEVQIFV